MKKEHPLMCGKNNPAFKDGRCSAKHYCIICKINEISYTNWLHGKQQCTSCYRKSLKGGGNPMFGRRGVGVGNYIDGRTNRIYYCIEPGCHNEISLTNWKYGNRRCGSCAKKGKNNPRSGIKEDEASKFKRIKKVMDSLQLSPNKPERLLGKLLGKGYKYVGDGEVIIGNYIPDFISIKDKKIVELYGCYWHKCKICGFGNGKLPRDMGRLRVYSKLGYKLLIVWEHELENLNKLKERLDTFNS
jgi:G:T-mismatch repair DNA endonuclease (very short patch repair protein)